MIDMAEIGREIARLENSETTYSNCEKLSVLYAVKNGLSAATTQVRQSNDYSYAEESRTEIGAILANCNLSDVLPILEEHFEVIKAVHPREYRAVMQRMKKTAEG